MRKEELTVCMPKDIVTRVMTICTRNELIECIKNNSIDLKGYQLDLYSMSGYFKLTIENIKRVGEDSNFIIDDVEKLVFLEVPSEEDE